MADIVLSRLRLVSLSSENEILVADSNGCSTFIVHSTYWANELNEIIKETFHCIFSCTATDTVLLVLVKCKKLKYLDNFFFDWLVIMPRFVALTENGVVHQTHMEQFYQVAIRNPIHGYQCFSEPGLNTSTLLLPSLFTCTTYISAAI